LSRLKLNHAEKPRDSSFGEPKTGKYIITDIQNSLSKQSRIDSVLQIKKKTTKTLIVFRDM